MLCAKKLFWHFIKTLCLCVYSDFVDFNEMLNAESLMSGERDAGF